ncbi:MAG TPA: AbrB/MazE/SpoVT family DNA-binding domain-containing protein, partial [Thermoanaerobaculia bacterium]
MPTATVKSRGRVTLPKEVRSHLGLSEGDRLDFVIAADGSVRLLPVSGSVRRLYGMLRRAGAPAVTLAGIDEA